MPTLVPSGAGRWIAAIFTGAVVAAASASSVAISLDLTQTFTRGFPLGGTNHGWEFTVNSPIQVTDLGLLDLSPPNGISPDGFMIAHDLGLFRTDGTLLASATIGPGTGGLLLDNFRYVPVGPVTLSPGEHYAVVYYTATNNWPFVDEFVLKIPTFQVNPAINYIGARFGGVVGSLALPSDPTDPDGICPDRFGANFLFVPEPGVVGLMGLAGLVLRRRR